MRVDTTQENRRLFTSLCLQHIEYDDIQFPFLGFTNAWVVQTARARARLWRNDIFVPSLEHITALTTWAVAVSWSRRACDAGLQQAHESRVFVYRHAPACTTTPCH
jgi:hypothetical protein